MMTAKSPIFLGINIDHVATLRKARGAEYPDPVKAAIMAVKAGADGVTLHLREDRRHIQDADLYKLKSAAIGVPINLEMAATAEMIAIAESVKPEKCCLVPEKRAELTTEGGLDILSQEVWLRQVCQRLGAAGIEVSLFIDPDLEQIEAAKRCQAPTVELTTSSYAEAKNTNELAHQLAKFQCAAKTAAGLELMVNAGHGLHYENVSAIAAIDQIHELNIGHSIISYSVYWGIETAVKKMKELMTQARKIPPRV